MKENPNFDFYSFNLPNEQEREQSAPRTEAPAAPAADSSVHVPPSAFAPPARPAPEHLHRARRAYSRAGWALTVMTLVWNVSAFVMKLLCLLALPSWLGIDAAALEQDPLFLLLTGTLPLYVFGLPALLLMLLGRPTERPPRQRFGAGRFTIAFFIALGLSIVGNFMGTTFLSVIGGFTGYEFSNIVNQTLQVPLWASVLFVSIITPFFEELIFRKILIDHLRPYGEFGAILMSALLFGAFHSNFYQFFYAAFFGAVLAYVYVRSGSIWTSVLMHLLFNLFCGVLPELLMGQANLDALLGAANEQQMLSMILENFNGYVLLFLYYFLLYSLAAVGLILLLVLRRRLFLVKTRDELPRAWRAEVMFGNGGMIVLLLFYALLFVLLMMATAQPLM